MLYLIRPELKYFDTFKKAVAEYKNDTTAFCTIHPVQKMIDNIDDFEKYLTTLEAEEKGKNLPAGHVRSTTFWLMDDDEYIGTFLLRHELTDNLLKCGGHIAYQIAPSKRGKGYAKAGLKLLLAEAKKIGLDDVLLTCDEQNPASGKVMHAMMLEMGGRQAPTIYFQNKNNRRYWIKTTKRHDGKIRTSAMAVIQKNGKILACKGYDEIKGEHFYRLLGGGVDFFEKAEDALLREIKEEIGIDIIIKRRLDVVENLFEFNGKKGHEIIFLFEAELPEIYMNQDSFPLIEPQHEGSKAEFVDKSERIYPVIDWNVK